MEHSTMAIDETGLLAEAQRIEREGGEWKIGHVKAVLGIAKSTVYNTAWLLKIAKPIGKRGMRWNPAEVRAGKPLTDAARRRSGTY